MAFLCPLLITHLSFFTRKLVDREFFLNPFMTLSNAVFSSCVDRDPVGEIHSLEGTVVGTAWPKSLAPILGTPEGYSVLVTFVLMC